MPYEYDYIVFIGRLEPPHNAHFQVIRTALSLAERVIVVLGSADQPRTPKNPFTVSERVGMLIAPNWDDQISRLRVTAVRDSMYNNQKWVNDVQNMVAKQMSWHDLPPKVGIIGHKKDESSFYLDMFPQWKLVEHEMDEELSATDLRELYFEGKNLKYLQALVPDNVYRKLDLFRRGKEYAKLVQEYNFLKAYKEKWATAPFPPTFVTVDAVVVQSGHILLVQRKTDAYGGDLWALPGGFLNQKEWVEDAMLRELREETKLKVPTPVLRGSIKAQHVFDAPNRSQRGRTITHAYHIELPSGPLPKVKGSDDAQDAKWFSTSDIQKKWPELFEDHGDIISYFNVGV